MHTANCSGVSRAFNTSEGLPLPPFGLGISVGTNPAPAAANQLFQALRAAGLTVIGNFDPKTDAESVSLVVGVQE